MPNTTIAKAQSRKVDASNLLHIGTIGNAYPEHVLEVQPRKIEAISLGEFTLETEPKGFTMEVIPKECESSVVAHMARISATYDTHDLMLHVANYSDREVTVEIVRS